MSGGQTEVKESRELMVTGLFGHQTTRDPVSGRLFRDHQQEGADHHGRDSRRVSAAGIRFLVILFPLGRSASLTVSPRATAIRPGWTLAGFHVPHAQDTTGEGALCSPGTGGAQPSASVRRSQRSAYGTAFGAQR
jgi:hypothetical protein